MKNMDNESLIKLQNEPALRGGGTPQTRNSNLELFRIITMLLIVAHHYVVNSGLTDPGGPVYSSSLTGHTIFLLLFGAWGKTGINCFVLITGYFMCKSRITARKYVKLLLEVELYKIIFYFVFLAAGYVEFTPKYILKSVLPIIGVTTDFTGCYLMFYLCIPFLNVLLHNINERQHFRLLLLSGFIYIFLGTVPKITVSMNYVSWFIVLYFIAAYVRMYPKKIYENVWLWSYLTLISLVLSVVSIIVCRWVGGQIGRPELSFYFVSDSNKILAMATAFCAFMFFNRLNLRYNRMINTIAASTFGVLMIHANSDAMRQWLWRDTLNNVGMYDSPWLVIHAVGSVMGVFLVCTLIDQARIYFVERPFFKFWDEHWNKIYEKYEAFASTKWRKLCRSRF